MFLGHEWINIVLLVFNDLLFNATISHQSNRKRQTFVVWILIKHQRTACLCALAVCLTVQIAHTSWFKMPQLVQFHDDCVMYKVVYCSSQWYIVSVCIDGNVEIAQRNRAAEDNRQPIRWAVRSGCAVCVFTWNVFFSNQTVVQIDAAKVQKESPFYTCT